MDIQSKNNGKDMNAILIKKKENLMIKTNEKKKRESSKMDKDPQMRNRKGLLTLCRFIKYNSLSSLFLRSVCLSINA